MVGKPTINEITYALKTPRVIFLSRILELFLQCSISEQLFELEETSHHSTRENLFFDLVTLTFDL